MLKKILNTLSSKALFDLSDACLDVSIERRKAIKDYFDQHGQQPPPYIMDASFSKTIFSAKVDDNYGDDYDDDN